MPWNRFLRLRLLSPLTMAMIFIARPSPAPAMYGCGAAAPRWFAVKHVPQSCRWQTPVIPRSPLGSASLISLPALHWVCTELRDVLGKATPALLQRPWRMCSWGRPGPRPSSVPIMVVRAQMFQFVGWGHPELKHLTKQGKGQTLAAIMGLNLLHTSSSLRSPGKLYLISLI